MDGWMGGHVAISLVMGVGSTVWIPHWMRAWEICTREGVAFHLDTRTVQFTPCTHRRIIDVSDSSLRDHLLCSAIFLLLSSFQGDLAIAQIPPHFSFTGRWPTLKVRQQEGIDSSARGGEDTGRDRCRWC